MNPIGDSFWRSRAGIWTLQTSPRPQHTHPDSVGTFRHRPCRRPTMATLRPPHQAPTKTPCFDTSQNTRCAWKTCRKRSVATNKVWLSKSIASTFHPTESARSAWGSTADTSHRVNSKTPCAGGTFLASRLPSRFDRCVYVNKHYVIFLSVLPDHHICPCIHHHLHASTSSLLSQANRTSCKNAESLADSPQSVSVEMMFVIVMF